MLQDLTREPVKSDLERILPQPTVMVISVTATTVNGRKLTDQELARVIAACSMVDELDGSRRKVGLYFAFSSVTAAKQCVQIISYVEERMVHIAPNLTAIVGSSVAAKLMGIAGGLSALSRMPSCNVQILGRVKRTLAGFSTKQIQPHQGVLFLCDIVQNTPKHLQAKAARLVAGKYVHFLVGIG